MHSNFVSEGSTDFSFKHLLDQSSDLIQRVSASGRLTYVNSAWMDVLGYKTSALSQRHWLEVVHPQSRDRLQQLAQALLATASAHSQPESPASLQVDHLTLQTASGCPITVSGYLEYRHSSAAEPELWCLWRLSGNQQAHGTGSFYSLIEHMPVGIVQKTLDGRITIANRALAQIYGFETLEAFSSSGFSRPTMGYVNPDHWYKLLLLLQEEGYVERLVTQIRRRDGSLVWIAESGFLVGDRPQTEPYYQGIVEEISEHKSVEQALRESKIQFQNLVANIPGMIFRLSRRPDGTLSFSYVSPGCRDIFKVEPEAFLADAEVWLRSILEQERTSFHETLAQSAQSSSPWSWEGRIQTASGQVSWVQTASRPQDQPDGSIVWDGVLIDITSRKHAEERLRLLESAVMNANDSILITEASPIDFPGPRIVYANSAFLSNTGYTLDEVLGKTPRLLQGKKTDRATIDRVREALSNWQPIDVELVNYRKDGTEFWIDMSIVPITDSNGWYTHWMAIQRDITQRKRMEEEIVRALEKERELSVLKSRFISTTSHEFRTPLTSILSSVEILNYFENTEQERQELFQQIYGSIQNLTRLLDDVLLISRAESDRLSLDCIDLDLEAFVEKSVSQAKQSFGKHHTFCCTRKGTPQKGFADPKLLNQVMNNLLSNAVKYSERGSLITVDLDFQPDACRFHVQDQGIGIPQEDQARLFEFFHRGSNVGSISGTGLGLAIVKKAVDLHGGSIRVTSQLHQGTTISIALPLHRDRPST